jgi:hypothetical protein
VPTIDPGRLLYQLAVGAPEHETDAIAALLAESAMSDDPTTVVVAALFTPEPCALLARAHDLALTTRDRQMVVIASAYVGGDRDLVDALARDHLTDHPDSVVVAWIAGAAQRDSTGRDIGPNPS